jgi:hypothetical protein
LDLLVNYDKRPIINESKLELALTNKITVYGVLPLNDGNTKKEKTNRKYVPRGSSFFWHVRFDYLRISKIDANSPAFFPNRRQHC